MDSSERIELMIDNAATASQNESLLDDKVTREAIVLNVVNPLQGEIKRLLDAMQEAIDMLLERKHGNPARSASHNARVVLQYALTGDVCSPLPADNGRAE